MRYIIAFIFLILLSSCNDKVVVKDKLIHHVPSNSKIIISSSSSDDLNSFMNENGFINELSETARMQQFKKESSFLSNYDIQSNSFITISPEGKNGIAVTFITKGNQPQLSDTTGLQKTTYNEVDYYHFKDQNSDFYYVDITDFHLASSSQLVIESLIRRNIKDYVFDQEFASIYNSTKGSDLQIYIKAESEAWFKEFMTYGNHKSYDNDYASWYQVQPLATDLPIHLDGILTYKDSTKQFHRLFNNLKPVENQAVSIIPNSIESARVISYDNPDLLLSNLDSYKQQELKPSSFISSLIKNSQEIISMDTGKEKLLAFTLKPYEELFTDIDSASIAKFNYRGYTVYELESQENSGSLAPILPSKEYKYVTVIDQFLLLTTTSTAPETIISNYQNKTVINERAWWNTVNSELSSNSTLLYFYSPDHITNSFKDKDRKTLKGLNADSYPMIVSQYVHEDNYAHYRLVVASASDVTLEKRVAQIGTYKSANKIIAGPFLFPNHKNGQLDIAFQDEDFNLHLLSKKGTKYWSKSLDSPIIGEINAVDGFRNGRKQLLFATQNKVYYLDRNGKDVNSFPLTFKDNITQPLSVFDYDSNRNYRLLVTQDDELLMYDIKGKKISGFES